MEDLVVILFVLFILWIPAGLIVGLILNDVGVFPSDKVYKTVITAIGLGPAMWLVAFIIIWSKLIELWLKR